MVHRSRGYGCCPFTEPGSRACPRTRASVTFPSNQEACRLHATLAYIHPKNPEGFWLSCRRQSEFLSQSVLQAQIVFLLRRDSAVPGIHFVHEFNVEIHEWAFPTGKEKSTFECHANAKEKTDRQTAVRWASGYELSLKPALFKCSVSCLAKTIQTSWQHSGPRVPFHRDSWILLRTHQPGDKPPGSQMQRQEDCKRPVPPLVPGASPWECCIAPGMHTKETGERELERHLSSSEYKHLGGGSETLLPIVIRGQIKKAN